MYNLLKKRVILFGLVLLGIACIGMAEPTALNSDATTTSRNANTLAQPIVAETTGASVEATSAANQLNSLAKKLEQQQKNKKDFAYSINLFNMDVAAKLKTIIFEIESEREKLVNIITNKPILSRTDSDKINNVIAKLESERSHLSNLIYFQSAMTPSAPSVTEIPADNSIQNTSLNVFAKG